MMAGMNRIRLAIVGWSIFLVGLLLFVRQLSAGGQSDLLFDLSVVLMISGTVLRLYASYRPRNRRPAARSEPSAKLEQPTPKPGPAKP